ncbi:Hypothetical predicted protein [Paramuricea clavata]|uniref:Uncharacterized protein n=1 Tax=Paramuricea clavata TaxID=317549 RepID=A0A6S7IHY4_PARCT|nr:Hypothetical predicted protein [Paramuricea clavata]
MEYEFLIAGLQSKVQSLEIELEAACDRLVQVHAGMLASSQQDDMTIEVRNVTLPLLYLSNKSLSFACYRVVAMEDIRVMPHTEAIIPAKILDYSGGSTLGIIKPNHIEAIPGLMVGPDKVM